MKNLFWLGFIGLLLFEAANVFFIMPMPGSQEMNSIDAAYFLHTWRWLFRGLFALMLLIGLLRANWKRKWPLAIPILIVAAVIYMANFKMAADHMFYQPEKLFMVSSSENKVETDRLIIGLALNGEAKAYPIQFLGYHHQVYDSVGGKPVIVTYCTVCRTGRAYEPLVNGKHEKFRLVGMDHFNAMFEDATTGSWWRQVNGEAITGKLKGHQLPEFFSTQASLQQWMKLHPNTLVMQADPAFKKSYDTAAKFESGKSKSSLTRTDSNAWQDKSWVIGVRAGEQTKAYDWNELKKVRLVHDQIGSTPLLLVLASDDKSFFAFERPAAGTVFTTKNDTLFSAGHSYTIDGNALDGSAALKPLRAYQEFWHSWKTFNPATLK